jgi:putative transcriptional regulator
MGVILDRVTDTLAAEAVPGLGHLTAPGDVVHEGGPVEPGGVVALADFTDPSVAGSPAFGTIGFVSSDAGDITGAVSAIRLFAGYSGWGAGQLEDELEQGAWILARPVPDDVFGADPRSLWVRVLQRQGGQLALIARMPDDPSVN